MIKLLKQLFKGKTKPSLEEIYLAQSASLEDLERRQREINRGKTPWQLSGRGW